MFSSSSYNSPKKFRVFHRPNHLPRSAANFRREPIVRRGCYDDSIVSRSIQIDSSTTFQNQHFIAPNSTTFQNGDSFELRSQASRQNVKANSTALLGVQTNPHVAQGNQDVTHHVTFQELAQNCGDQILPKNAFSQVVDVQASHPSHIQTQSTTLPMASTYPKILTNFDKPKQAPIDL